MFRLRSPRRHGETSERLQRRNLWRRRVGRLPCISLNDQLSTFLFKMSESFRIRFATSQDADTIAWHRARMFQDMGDVSVDAFETLRKKARACIEEWLPRGAPWLGRGGQGTIVAVFPEPEWPRRGLAGLLIKNRSASSRPEHLARLL